MTLYIILEVSTNMNKLWFERYIRLIDHCDMRPLASETYVEKHHIVPRCFGGDNSKDNLIKLTAMEHYAAHYLLHKSYPGNKDLAYALGCMQTISNKRNLSTSQVSIAREIMGRSCRKSQESFLLEARKAHGNRYNYDKAVYTKCKSEVTISCPIHGDFEQIASSHLKGQGCYECGKILNGFLCRTTQKDFLTKAKKIHGKKYDYSLVRYETVNTKIKIICKHHGVFEQNPSDHIQGKGCMQCGRSSTIKQRTSTTAEFCNKAKKLHGKKYDYSLVDYKNNHTKVTIICPLHGEFHQSPGLHLTGNGCRACGYLKMSAKRNGFLLDNNGQLSLRLL